MNVFHGTGALVRSQLRSSRALWIGLAALGLGTGVLMRLGSADPDAIQWLLLLCNVLCLLICPTLAGAGLTLPISAGGINNAGYSRRDALLLLPTGRLALPATVFTASLTMVGMWWLVSLLSLSVALGPGQLVEAFSHGVKAHEAGAVVGCSLGGWVLLTSLVAIGPHSAASLAAWLLVPAALVGLLPAMGYGEDSQGLFALLAGVPLALVLLALPFVLYLRPRHLWFTAKKDMTARFDGKTTLGALLVALLFGLGGASWALVGVALAALPLVWAWRRAPAAQRGRWSHLRLCHTVGALVTSGVLVVGAGLDMAAVAATDDSRRGAVSYVALAPGGRYAAVELVRPVRGKDLDQALRRVHLIDLEGEQPPRVFPQRFAQLARTPYSDRVACWSRDGRYLAFTDQGLGRLCFGAVATDGLSYLPPGAWEPLTMALFYGTADVVVFDTHTGETERVDGALFAPGWETPADLARLSIDLRGRLVVNTGHGAELRLESDRIKRLVVVDYVERSPLIDTGRHQDDGGLQAGDRIVDGRVADAGLVWLTPDGLATPPEPTGRWHEVVTYLGPPGPDEAERRHSEVLITDGEQELWFPATGAESPVGLPIDGYQFLRVGSALCELHIDSGTRRELLTAEEGERVLDLTPVDGGLFGRIGARWYWIQPGAEPRELPAWVGRPHGWLGDGSLLAEDGTQWVVGDDRRPLVALGR